MKAIELEELIRESVKKALEEKHVGFNKLKTSLAHKKGVKDPGAVAASIGRKKYGSKAMSKAAKSGKALGEGAEYSDGSLGADIQLEPKVERAVMLAVHCAKVLTGGVAKQPGEQGSTLEKCFDEIIGLFLDDQGGFSVPDLNPDELKNEFTTQLDHQMTNPESKIARVSRAILDKVVDKLNVFVGEAMIAEVAGSLEEAGYDQYGENMSDEMITEALYEKHIGFQNLVNQLKSKGHSEESAKKIAYKIGVNKYGKQKMATAAKKHKPLSDKQALKKEHQEIPTDPAWFDTQSDTEMHSREPKRDNPESRKFIEKMKRIILHYHKETGKKITEDSLSDLVQQFSHYELIPDDVVWDLAHAAIDELQDKGLFESPPSGWHGTVAAMKQHGHTGKGPGKIDNPYALANYMANKGEEPHYKEQPSSMHGRPRKKKGQ